MRCKATLHKVESTWLAWECFRRKTQKGFFWIKFWNYRILCFAGKRGKKDENQRHRWSFFPLEKCCLKNVLFTCQKILKGWEKKQGPLLFRCWSWRPWTLWQPPCQAAVNKASAELKNGNEFLIGDTLYLSSWQRSDCAAAFLFCPCARITSPYVPLHDTPYSPGSLTCE